MRYIFPALLILSFPAALSAQEDLSTIIDKTLSYRGLSRDDITIPAEFYSGGEKSPTNDSKLLLPVVQEIMADPLGSVVWLKNLSSLPRKREYTSGYDHRLLPDILSYFSGLIVAGELPGFEIYSPAVRKPLTENIFSGLLKNAALMQKNLTRKFSAGEMKFLQENVLSVIEDTEKDDPSNFDIFAFNRMRDSSISVSRSVMDILSRLDMQEVVGNSAVNFKEAFALYNELRGSSGTGRIGTGFGNDDPVSLDNDHVKGDFLYYFNKNGLLIAIGGTSKNIYTGRFDIIIDAGGDDVYDLDGDISFNKGFSCIIDLSGNDHYSARSDFCMAASVFSSSFIFDKEGDDFYACRNVGLGASIGGLGLLYDENGNDSYHGMSFSTGAGAFGIGIVVDIKGNDVYSANSYSQGFGLTAGAGGIVDLEGNDSYLVDARSLDIGRYEDHYVSMCQGFGLGLRPYYAGGVGIILEVSGNDIYNTDIFGQGGAYWYSLGAIVDISGHDKYNGYQYSQGSGIHLAVGLLNDRSGWDFYSSNGVSQGCGHDFGFGMLWDTEGNDNYSAYSLSQGAGNANGIGMLVDQSGRDGYLSKDVNNTRGYGNPRREFGSIGVFIDASGNDFYSVPGNDSTFLNRSNWGVMTDNLLPDPPEQSAVNEYKVKVDSGRKYSTSELFTMAKTIEPRFSLWQEYGFNRLVQDSINTAGYLLSELATDDHRETLLMRNLGRRIRRSVTDALKEKLDGYVERKLPMSPAEVSFACYVLGETQYPASGETLLKLTNDESIRVRSSAVNALGKLNYDTSGTGFKERVSFRLTELALEKSDKKLYRKDIAFAFGNFRDNRSIPVLIEMMSDRYFGVRFLASECLKKYGTEYSNIIDAGTLSRIMENGLWSIAFLYSLEALPDDKFISLVDPVLLARSYSDEALRVNLMQALNERLRKEPEAEHRTAYSKMLESLKSGFGLKVK